MTKYALDPNTGQWVKIKQSHRARNFVLFPALGLIALFGIIGIASAGSNPGPVVVPGNGPASATPTGTGGHHVHYEVTGSGTGDVTYSTDANGSSSQANGAALPWTQDVQISSFFAPLYVSAQHSSGSGDVACQITVDGKVVSSNHASGQYAIASCSGSIG